MWFINLLLRADTADHLPYYFAALSSRRLCVTQASFDKEQSNP